MKEKLQVEVICELCILFCHNLWTSYNSFQVTQLTLLQTVELKKHILLFPLCTPKQQHLQWLCFLPPLPTHYVMMPITLLPLGKKQHMLLLVTLYVNSMLALSLGLKKWVRCQVFKLLIPSYLKNFLSKSKLANMIIESIN